MNIRFHVGVDWGYKGDGCWACHPVLVIWDQHYSELCLHVTATRFEVSHGGAQRSWPRARCHGELSNEHVLNETAPGWSWTGQVSPFPEGQQHRLSPWIA